MINNFKNLKKFGNKVKEPKEKTIRISGFVSLEKIQIEEMELLLLKVQNKLKVLFLVIHQIVGAVQP